MPMLQQQVQLSTKLVLSFGPTPFYLQVLQNRQVACLCQELNPCQSYIFATDKIQKLKIELCSLTTELYRFSLLNKTLGVEFVST